MPVYEMTLDDDELGLMESEPKPNRKFICHMTWLELIVNTIIHIRNQTFHSLSLILIENSAWILNPNSGILIYLSDFVASLQKVKLLSEVNSENNGSFALASYVQNWSNSLTPIVNDNFCKPDTTFRNFFLAKTNLISFV